MPSVTIADISPLYDIQGQTKVRMLRARHEPFRQFSVELQKLVRSLQACDDDTVLRSLRILKRIRFDLCAAPLSFNNPHVSSDQLMQFLHSATGQYSQYDPEHYAGFLRVLALLEDLTKLPENPLFDQIKDQLPTTTEATIALKESRHISALEEILSAYGPERVVRVVSQHQLKRCDACYETLFLVGATSWFPEFLFRVPRAVNTFVVSYSWLGRRLSTPKPLFAGWSRISGAVRHDRSTVVVEEPEQPTVISAGDSYAEINSEEILPQISLPLLMKEVSRSAGHQDDPVFVTARLCRLENGRGLLVEDREGARSLVIDLDEEDRSKVKRVTAAQLTPGMFIIMRSDEDNETDYIVPLADLILGVRAESLRRFQTKWKESLRSAVKSHGTASVIRTLRQKGSIRASEVNLSNWMSRRNIRTEDRRDFDAIMNVIGWSSEADKCWQFSGEIDRAHRRAGRLVRKRLMRLVNATDLTDLERLGEMKFELGEVGARPLLAVRLLEISSDSISISQSRLHRPFPLPE